MPGPSSHTHDGGIGAGLGAPCFTHLAAPIIYVAISLHADPRWWWDWGGNITARFMRELLAADAACITGLMRPALTVNRRALARIDKKSSFAVYFELLVPNFLLG